jgi:hypothetical protein
MSELDDKGLPPQAAVEDALYEYLSARGSQVAIQTVYRELAVIMRIPPAARRAKRDSDERSLWENLVRFAKRRRVDKGLMNDQPRGLWSVKVQS